VLPAPPAAVWRVAGDPGQGGATWAVLQYVLGLRELGHDVVLVEPAVPSAPVAEYFAAVMRRFGLDGRAALLDPSTGESIGLARGALLDAVAGADLVARELARPTLEQRFLDLLAARGVAPESLYTGPAPSALFFLAEGLLEYEQQFARWRFAHVQLVERIIGPMTQGTGGSLGAGHLARTVAHRFFPFLWQVRARLYGAARAAAPPATRP